MVNCAIVLTGTIVPNSNFTTYTNPQVRRAEYLAAIHYYSGFAPVYFLENSAYDLASDPEFISSEDVAIRKFPVSKFAERGKGFQEFEMLDAWLNQKSILQRAGSK